MTEVQRFKQGGCKNNWAHITVYDNGYMEVEYMGVTKGVYLKLPSDVKPKDAGWGTHLANPANDLMYACRKLVENITRPLQEKYTLLLHHARTLAFFKEGTNGYEESKRFVEELEEET